MKKHLRSSVLGLSSRLGRGHVIVVVAAANLVGVGLGLGHGSGSAIAAHAAAAAVDAAICGRRVRLAAGAVLLLLLLFLVMLVLRQRGRARMLAKCRLVMAAEWLGVVECAEVVGEVILSMEQTRGLSQHQSTVNKQSLRAQWLDCGD